MAYPDLRDKPEKQRAAICYSLWQGKKTNTQQAISLLRNRPWSRKGRTEDTKAMELDNYAVDAFPLNVDESKMCATGVLATNALDRQGDVMDIKGIRTDRHQFNPIALIDHGLWYPLPIGKTEDPDGNYTVSLGENEATQTTYFSQHDQMAEQCFHLLCEKVLRGNSIRFENAEFDRIPAD